MQLSLVSFRSPLGSRVKTQVLASSRQGALQPRLLLVPAGAQTLVALCLPISRFSSLHLSLCLSPKLQQLLFCSTGRLALSSTGNWRNGLDLLQI